MLKAFKYRIYPNKEQIIQINKTFGSIRFVFNRMLQFKKDLYDQTELSYSKIDCNNWCNKVLKDENYWLKEVDKFALTNAIYNMNNAYQKFFKEHTGFPKYKSKKNNNNSYTTNYTNNNIKVDFNSNYIKLPKLTNMKIKLHRKFDGKIKSATISRTPTDKYYISIFKYRERVSIFHNEFFKGGVVYNGSLRMDCQILD